MRIYPMGYEALRMSAGGLNMCMVKTPQLVDKPPSYVTVHINKALKLQYFRIY